MMAPYPATWSAQRQPPRSQAPSRVPLGIMPLMVQLKPALTPQALPQPRLRKKKLRPALPGNVGPGLRELRGAVGLTPCSPLSSHCALEGPLGANLVVSPLRWRLGPRDVPLSPGPTVGSSRHPS